MTSRHLNLYFDFVSPYAYMAWRYLRQHPEARDWIAPCPIVFAAVLDAHGQLGPAEIPAKRRFVISDSLRSAHRLGLPLVIPPVHPFRSLDALRLCLPMVAGDRQHDVIDALFAAAWEHGRDISSRSVLTAELEQLGLNASAMIQRIRQDDVKQALRRATETAIGDGVFGVPTFRVGDQLVWGSDRLDDALGLLHGDLVAIDPDLLESYLATPVGAVRRRDDGADPMDSTDQLPIDDDQARRLAAARELFARAPFVSHLGIDVVYVADGHVETRLALRPEMTQQHGVVHAGVITTLADHTAGAAAQTHMQSGQMPMTIEFKFNFLRPARGGDLRCIARTLRPGRSVTVVESEVLANDRTGNTQTVAKGIVTLAVVDAW